MTWFSCDPGKTGALCVWEDKEPIKQLPYNIKQYIEYFRQNPGSKLFLEYIATVMGGPYASFVLAKYIGEIKGACEALNIEVIEQGMTPKSWQKAIGIEKEKGQDVKELYIEKCKEIYPNINLKYPEIDENGVPKIVKKGPDKGTIKYYEHDGVASSIMIGHSAIIRNLI